jgi:TM2 domain-containing membrane protein YozV
MSESRFFLKTGSKVLGPLSAAQIESLQLRGRLKSEYVISTDKKAWKPIDDFFTGNTSHSSSIPLTPVDEEWYYAEDQRRIGPLSHAEILELIRKGRLRQDSLVWKDGFEKWLSIEDVPELNAHISHVSALAPSVLVPGPLPRICLKCGTHDLIGANFCPRCGNRYEQSQNHIVLEPSVRQGDRKDRLVAALLALFLGGLGIHHFYLGNTLLGIIYLLFCWTLIPFLISFIEGIVFLCTSNAAFDAQYNSLPGS